MSKHQLYNVMKTPNSINKAVKSGKPLDKAILEYIINRFEQQERKIKQLTETLKNK